MQAVGEAASGHDAARERVDDDDLVVLDDIVRVAVHDAVRAERLIDVVGDLGVLGIGEVLDAEILLRLRDAGGGQRRGLRLLVDDVVRVDVVVVLLGVELLDDILAERAGEAVRHLVEHVDLRALTGEDERGPRLVDEDGVDLVHDGECMAALDELILIEDAVVAQIVEAELVVRAVGDVAVVCLLLFRPLLVVDDEAGLQPEILVDAAHFLRADAGEVFVRRDDVDALSLERVEVGRQNGDDRLSFAGLHLGDPPLMEEDAAHDLHVERPLAEDAVGCLAHAGIRLGEDVVEGLARRQSFLEDVGPGAHIRVGHGPVLVRERIHALHGGHDFSDLSLAVGAENLGDDAHFIETAALAACPFLYSDPSGEWR